MLSGTNQDMKPTQICVEIVSLIPINPRMTLYCWKIKLTKWHSMNIFPVHLSFPLLLHFPFPTSFFTFILSPPAVPEHADPVVSQGNCYLSRFFLSPSFVRSLSKLTDFFLDFYETGSACKCYPLWGTRFSCSICNSYDLCESCYDKDLILERKQRKAASAKGTGVGDEEIIHKREHKFIAIEIPVPTSGLAIHRLECALCKIYPIVGHRFSCCHCPSPGLHLCSFLPFLFYVFFEVSVIFQISYFCEKWKVHFLILINFKKYLGQGCFFSGKKIKGHSPKHETRIFIEDRPDEKKWFLFFFWLFFFWLLNFLQ